MATNQTKLSVYDAELNLKTAKRKLRNNQPKQASMLCNASEDILAKVIDSDNLDADYAGAVAIELIRVRRDIREAKNNG